MDALPLIALAGAAFLFLGKKNSNSEKTDGKKSKDEIVVAGNIKLVDCKVNEFNDNGICKKYWIDGETDLAVSQALDALIESKYKGKSWDEMCADKKVDNGAIIFLPNTNSLEIVKTIIANLWKPVITKKMLPPKDSSPEYVKVVWKKVTAIYFNKVCGLV